MSTFASRFWSHVQVGTPAECWLWQGSKTRKGGYGAINVGGRTLAAHRVAYLLDSGLREIPAGRYVCHACDVPACVNPSHLWLGTQKDNIRDLWRKGRGRIRRGAQHHKCKLTEPLVREIRTSREKHADMAARLGVSVATIGDIRSGRTWGHVR